MLIRIFQTVDLVIKKLWVYIACYLIFNVTSLLVLGILRFTRNRSNLSLDNKNNIRNPFCCFKRNLRRFRINISFDSHNILAITISTNK